MFFQSQTLYLCFLEKKFADNRIKMTELDILNAKLERNLDSFRKELYSGYEPQIQHIDSIDIDMQGNVFKHFSTSGPMTVCAPAVSNSKPVKLPPVGAFIFPQIKVNQGTYFYFFF